jgi:hypothetical protein
MIKEDYVSFEVAKLLKEKGFDGDINCYYIEESADKNLCYSPIKQNHNKRITNNEFDIDINVSSEKISAPTLQMTMKWLLKKYNIFICILFLEESNGFGYTIENIVKKEYITTSENDGYSTYEETAEEAIKYCLENLI